MSFLEALVKGRFPAGAQVERCSHRDAYYVTVIIDEKDVAAGQWDRAAFARDTLKKLTPRRRIKRRLHWGRRIHRNHLTRAWAPR